MPPNNLPQYIVSFRMWQLVVISVNLFACTIIASPAQSNVIAKNFQAAVQQQNLQTILLSIEERLRNLDNIYSMQLSPTLEGKIDQYHRKLEAIDTKIIRLESLVMFNLDKISENISTKNYKDDISKTSFLKKIDSLYEGINHRLGYIDRKIDSNSIKIQSKLETISTRLNKMEDAFALRDEDIDNGLTDTIAAVEDLKTTSSLIEETTNTTKEYVHRTFEYQQTLIQKTEILDKNLQSINDTIQNINKEIKLNITNEFLNSLKSEIKEDLNEYAVKVAEMNLENWRSGKILSEKQITIEHVINATRIELQNSLRAVMVLIGKFSTKENQQNEDKQQVDQFNKKLDTNFEKLFRAQNMFMDSCYRLQMDESQIESKISIILEKLIETFEKKTSVEIKDVRNLEKLIKNHDTHITRNLYQLSINLIALFNKITIDKEKFDGDVKKIFNNLNALFALVQEGLLRNDDALRVKHLNVLLQDMANIERKVIELGRQNETNSIRDLNELIVLIKKANVTSEHFVNNNHMLNRTVLRINNLLNGHLNKYNRVTQKFEKQLQEYIDQIKIGTMKNFTNETTNDDLTNMPIHIQNKTKCFKNDYLHLIDVRGGFQDNDCEEDLTNRTQIDDDFHKTLIEIFGLPPNSSEKKNNATHQATSTSEQIVDAIHNKGAGKNFINTTNFTGTSNFNNSDNENGLMENLEIVETTEYFVESTTVNSNVEHDNAKSVEGNVLI